MKRILAFACIASLAACSGSEEAAEPAAQEEIAVEEVAFDPAALSTAEESAGTYDLVYADGSIGEITLTGDGSFSFTMGDETSTGTFEMPGTGKYCYTVESGSAADGCFTNSALNEDGTWLSTNDENGDVTIVSLREG
ncbi:hypothetical protein [Aurantiacibacter marinus]|uniref:Uncharacterized protein n=1 Tax=Aurantiacibacter marinus TaxID=874156 RepID=A0A0H0XLE1_9SPHN|nr:hypothetical protein [Aurantiacibacter marinus]KLI62786.1 hypothetical protein AAV99_13450 [Aurantiacibacter marinus]